MWMPQYLESVGYSFEEIFLLISMLLSSTCLKVPATYDHATPKVRVGQMASFDPQLPSGVNPTPVVLAWNFVIAMDLVR